MALRGIFLQEEKEMATHSSILAWRIPWTEEPGGLLSIKKKKNTCDQLEKLSGAEEQWTAVTSESSV